MTVAISAGGTATVGNGDVVIVYGSNGATLKRLIANSVKVFIPVANPPDQVKILNNISFECKGTENAMVTDLVVTFGRDTVLTKTGLDETSDFSVAVAAAKGKADSEPYGIDVTLTVSLPTDCSTMEINSVTLYFG